MNCERIREQIPEALAGRLNKADRDALVEHLEGCAGCRTEVAELNAVWRGLETVKSGMDDAAPDAGAKVRFQEMLAAYQAGMAAAQASARTVAPRSRGRACRRCATGQRSRRAATCCAATSRTGPQRSSGWPISS